MALVTVTATSTHTYTILRDMDIDWGAGPDRTNKIITINCISQEPNIKDDGTGSVFDYSWPVTIEAFVRDTKARPNKREPQQLIKLEKDIIQFLTLNKFGLQEDGISHIVVRNSQIRAVDEEEMGLANWYKLTITVLLQYRLKYAVI